MAAGGARGPKMSVVEPSPDFWARKRVCVTGGTGFLGYHIVQQLVTLGAGVRIDYVQAKRAAEQLAFAAAARGRHVIVTNPGYLLGPEDHEHSVMGRFCLRFWKGRMPVAPPGGLSLADVRDVARGHLLAAE